MHNQDQSPKEIQDKLGGQRFLTGETGANHFLDTFGSQTCLKEAAQDKQHIPSWRCPAAWTCRMRLCGTRTSCVDVTASNHFVVVGFFPAFVVASNSNIFNISNLSFFCVRPCASAERSELLPVIVLPLLQGIQAINHESGSTGDVEGSVVSATVPSVSVKWMKSRNRCDTTETSFFCTPRFKACFHPSSKRPLHNNTENMAAQQVILLTTLMRRATDNM